METLSYNFFVLQCIGLWRPVHWSTGWKTRFYDCYTFLMGFLIATVTLSEFINLVTSVNNIEAFADNSFLLMSLMAGCGKGASILKKRGAIIELTNVLKKYPCRPINEQEITIQRKFDRLARSNTLTYGALVGISVVALALRSFVPDIPLRALPYECWLPFEHYASLLGYTIAYSHQIVTLATGAWVIVAFDTLVSGLMLQTCAQLNILKHRLHVIPDVLVNHARDFGVDSGLNSLNSNSETILLSHCIKHHLEIFQFAKKSNDLFGLMIFLQYTVSSIVLCMSVFRLSKMLMLSAEFTSHMMYVVCVLVQIFILCLYGGEVTFESLNVSDAIYEMNWNSFSTKAKKDLLTMMTRTVRPIKFKSFSFLVLDLDSFKSLLKLSYSTYNVLPRNGS